LGDGEGQGGVCAIVLQASAAVKGRVGAVAVLLAAHRLVVGEVGQGGVCHVGLGASASAACLASVWAEGGGAALGVVGRLADGP